MACGLTQCHMLPLDGSVSRLLCLFWCPVVVGWVLRPGQELAWGLKVGCPGGSQPGSFPSETGAGGLLAEGCVW